MKNRMNDRVFRPRLPARTVIFAVAIALAVLGFLIFAMVQIGRPIDRAWMTGTVVAKEFRPFEQREQRITLDANGQISARTVDGEYILTVDVPQEDGTTRPFKVWMPGRESFDQVKVGDSFNVGPYLQR